MISIERQYQNEIDDLKERWEEWRQELIDAWAKDQRATITALLEEGPY